VAVRSMAAWSVWPVRAVGAALRSLQLAGPAGAGAREEVELVATAVVAMPVVAMVAAGT